MPSINYVENLDHIYFDLFKDINIFAWSMYD